jgi:phospholipase/carboxylesterase
MPNNVLALLCLDTVGSAGMRLVNLGGLAVRLVGGSDGSGGGDGPVAVMLHGFGAPADDLIPLAEVLAPPGSVRFAFPGAPLTLPGMWGGGRAWWMIDVGRFERVTPDSMRELSDETPAGIDEAREQVMAMLVELEAELGVSGDRVVLGGFSQGAMLSCDVALRGARPLAGLMLMSGVMLSRPEWTARMPERAGLPVFQSHGRQDPLLPFQLAAELRDAMQAAGLAVDWLEFSGGHEIPLDVVKRASAFLRRVGSP